MDFRSACNEFRTQTNLAHIIFSIQFNDVCEQERSHFGGILAVQKKPAAIPGKMISSSILSRYVECEYCGDVDEVLTLYGILSITFCARNILLYTKNCEKYTERTDPATSYAILRYFMTAI